MPWKNQGGGGPQGPWGAGPGRQQPPDLEELLRKGQDRFRRAFPGRGGGYRGLLIVAGVAIVLWLLSGFYQVRPDEQGVVLRFGKWVATTQPGLNYHLPVPIETVLTPKVTRNNRADIGFRSVGSERVRGVGPRDVPEESLMLTGDENIIDIDFTVLWQIKDAGQYLFNIDNPEATVRDTAESAMREVIGQTDIALALAEGRNEIEQRSKTLLQRILDDYGAGILITQVQIQKSDPPQAVIDAYRDVQAARADRERLRNEAEAYRNDMIPRARGNAEQMRQEAEAFREEVVARARGEGDKFLSIYRAYATARDVTVQRMYIETMEDILRGANKVIIDSDGAGAQSVLPYLPLPELRGRTNSQGGRR